VDEVVKSNENVEKETARKEAYDDFKRYKRDK
jgi:hypothetical protein